MLWFKGTLPRITEAHFTNMDKLLSRHRQENSSHTLQDVRKLIHFYFQVVGRTTPCKTTMMALSGIF